MCAHNRQRLIPRADRNDPMRFQCRDCDVVIETTKEDSEKARLEHETHTFYVDECFSCRVATVTFGAAAMITRAKSDVVYEKKMEKMLEVDRPAYRRLRHAGMTPKGVLGSARMEAEAQTRFEVESGKLFPGKAAQIDAAVNEMKEATGIDPWKPNATKLNESAVA